MQNAIEVFWQRMCDFAERSEAAQRPGSFTSVDFAACQQMTASDCRRAPSKPPAATVVPRVAMRDPFPVAPLPRR